MNDKDDQTSQPRADDDARSEPEPNLADLTAAYMEAAEVITEKTKDKMQALIEINKKYPKRGTEA